MLEIGIVLTCCQWALFNNDRWFDFHSHIRTKKWFWFWSFCKKSDFVSNHFSDRGFLILYMFSLLLAHTLSMLLCMFWWLCVCFVDVVNRLHCARSNQAATCGGQGADEQHYLLMSRPAPVNLRQRSHAPRCLRPTWAQRLKWQWIRHRCVVRCNRTWSRHHRPQTPLSRPFSAMSNSSLCIDLCPPCIVFQQLRPLWKESLATEASSCVPTGHAWVTLYSVTWCLLNAILSCKLDINQCLWSFW